ncbi:hypothetical protein KKH39_02160 [Patescibacteria group bacterium]|nr:hypothetical protein [Patescibacteria group bacterium]
MNLIDFSTEEDTLFPSPLIQGKPIVYAAGTYKLVRIANPGDPTIFPHDLLVIKKELDQGRMVGQSITSWIWASTQKDYPGLRVSIVPLKVLELLPQLTPTEDVSEDNDAEEAVNAS